MDSYWFLLTLTAVLVLPARARDLLDRLPQCVLNCSSQFIEQIPCSVSDKPCLCTNTETLVGGISACAGASCRVRDVLFSTNTTLDYCDVPTRDDSLTLEIITGVFSSIALLVVILRMVTRMRPFKSKFGWDDGLILSVVASTIVLLPIQFIMTHHGFGRDIYTIPPDSIETIFKLFYISESFYCYSISVTKLSVLCFYLRIFADPNFKRRIHILMGICSAYLVAVIPTVIWQCTPISYMWTSWSGETEGNCINFSAFSWSATAINILLDIAVIVLPIPQLLKLNLSKRKKIQSVAMFSMGLFVTLTSVVRMHSLIDFRFTNNFSRDYLTVGYMSQLEVNVGIVCTCMPAMRLFLRHIAPGLSGSTANSSSHLRPHTSSREKRHRSTNTHHRLSKGGITKTTTTTVTDMSEGSESIVELVDNPRNHSEEGVSFTTTSMEAPHTPKR